MKPDDLVMRACRNQVDFATGVVQSITEGSSKMQERNLQAANDVTASFAAAQQRMAQASGPQDLWRIQAKWASENVENALAYWRDLSTIALGAQSAIVKRLAQEVQRIDPDSTLLDTRGNFLEVMDRAYKQWLETTSASR